MNIQSWIKALVLVLLAGGGIGCSQVVYGQQAENEEQVRIILKDGTQAVGVIVEETATTVILRTQGGVTMTIPRDQIESISPFDGNADLDPNRTRLFFAPTGRSLGHREGYVALYQIFLPFAAVGVKDVASLAGGVSLIPGSTQQLVYFAPKITFYERPNVAVAAGTFVATVTGEGDLGGLLYGVSTFSRAKGSLTLGVGFAFGGGEFEETPLLLVGGDYQIGRSLKLLSENYIVPGVEGGVLFLGGLRFIGDRLSVDVGLITTPEVFSEGGLPFLPWLGFAYNFGS